MHMEFGLFPPLPSFLPSLLFAGGRHQCVCPSVPVVQFSTFPLQPFFLLLLPPRSMCPFPPSPSEWLPALPHQGGLSPQDLLSPFPLLNSPLTVCFRMSPRVRALNLAVLEVQRAPVSLECRCAQWVVVFAILMGWYHFVVKHVEKFGFQWIWISERFGFQHFMRSLQPGSLGGSWTCIK